MEVSAILPVHNGENFIFEALDSIRKQTLPVREIIVIDDHSTDRSVDIAQGFGELVRIIENPSQGQPSAINEGIRQARSEFLAFIDHDDLWSADKNRLSSIAFSENANVDVVTAGLTNFLDGADMKSQKSFNNARVFGSCTFRKKAFLNVGYLKEDIRNHSIIEWWMRPKARELNLFQLHENLYLRRIHSSNSGISSLEVARKDLFKVLRNSYHEPNFTEEDWQAKR